MKNTQKTLKKIIKEEIAKVLKERFQPSSDDPPHKVNAIRIQELEGKLAHQAGEIDQLYGLIEEISLIECLNNLFDYSMAFPFYQGLNPSIIY